MAANVSPRPGYSGAPVPGHRWIDGNTSLITAWDGAYGQYYNPDGTPKAGTPDTLDPTLLADTSGSDPNALASNLLKAQFANWESQFKPIELSAINQVSSVNPSILPAAVDKARGAAEAQSGSLRGVLSRGNASLGIAPTAQQAASTSRVMNLNQAATVAGAENNARSNVRAQDEQIILGSAPNPNILKGQ